MEIRIKSQKNSENSIEFSKIVKKAFKAKKIGSPDGDRTRVAWTWIEFSKFFYVVIPTFGNFFDNLWKFYNFNLKKSAKPTYRALVKWIPHITLSRIEHAFGPVP